MIYETKGKYSIVCEDGNEKDYKESYIVEEAETFADAELQTMEYIQVLSKTNLDVTDVKRSKAKEIANSRQSDDDSIWIAELMDIFLTDEGEEKTIKYKVFLFAKTFDAAKEFIAEYSKQGYDMCLVSLKLTKFVDVIK